MGGRGSSFSRTRSNTGPVTRVPLPQINPVNPNQPGVALPDQTPDDNNTPVVPNVDAISSLDDDGLAALVQQAKNVQMPNHLADVQNLTQQFVYAAGLNEKPTIMDSTAFNAFMAQHNIPQSRVLARSVNPISYTSNGLKYTLTANQIMQMFTNSRLNYIGGKVGGSAYGCGTYFAMTGGANTGYGGTTINAVLNPATARVITSDQLAKRAASFAKSHPKFAAAVGSYSGSTFGASTKRNNMSIYALAMGYNVISTGNSSGDYFNVIDRSAIIVRK